ncbi:hypothetical protein N0V93_007312 [Gnomoniopsis smithogilvyi]|uniref:Uncharacterized protein n=1 Tax=Gnomoniopsis smithogilvyi TaxID=1191159 RepID=A0A9W9CWH3_9PEZI|nr:hypothetical protein N0V93_007312 [Gnomoniopsis smithogilvyi]
MTSEDEIVSTSVQASGAKVPLRTYSRHGRIKRSSSSLPGHLPYANDLTSPDNHGNTHRGAQLGRQERKQRRATTPVGRTITEVFWEHLSSSAPPFTHQPETDDLVLGVSFQAEEDTAPINKQPHSDRAGNELYAQDDVPKTKRSLGQRAHDPSHGLRDLDDTRQDGRSLRKVDMDEILKKPRRFNDESLTYSPTPHTKSRKLLCLSSPPTRKTKRVRHSIDVDESLSVLETTSASPGPIAKILTARYKDSGLQEFRKPRNNNKVSLVASSDGFEREETRTGVFGKRRQIDSVDRSIGSLELTQEKVASQKIEGPTWIRGRRKLRVSTSTSFWSRRQYFSNSIFHVDSEEDDEPDEVAQSKSDGQGTRERFKGRTSHVVSDDDDETMALPAPDVSTDGHSTHSKADVEVVRKSRAKRVEDFPYISDADEHVMLLVHPEDSEDEASVAMISGTNRAKQSANNEEEARYVSDDDDSVALLVYPGDNEDDAALATIPRTDTPENVADIDQVNGVLPPKQWVLNALDYDEYTLALRPDSREWIREVEIPATSP